MNFAPHIGERRAGAGISGGHSPVAYGGKQHGHHSQQHRDYSVPVRTRAHHSVNWHGGSRLNNDEPIENQIPEPQRAA